MCFRTCIHSFPSSRDSVRRIDLLICIVAEAVAAYCIRSENKFHTVLLCQLLYTECYIEFVELNDRAADLAAVCFSEGIGHTAAEDEFVHLTEQVLDDTDLRTYFRASHDGYERTFDVFEDRVHSSYLFLHEETEHLVVCIEIVRDDSRRSMFAVSGTEGIHNIAVSVRSKGLSELFLTTLHLFFGFLVSRIFFLDTYRFTFLFRIETEVLEQQYLTRLERSSLSLCFGAVLSELNGTTQRSSYSVFDLTETELSLYFTFRFTHVAHDDERTALIQDVLQGRQRTADTGVVCDLTILIQRYIEVNTYDRLLAGEIEIFDSHNSNIFNL